VSSSSETPFLDSLTVEMKELKPSETSRNIIEQHSLTSEKKLYFSNKLFDATETRIFRLIHGAIL
jgi:hypothetical protein